MRNFIFLSIAVLISLQVASQTITPDFNDANKWQVVSRTAAPAFEDGKKAIRLSEADSDGLMILKDFNFSEGTIEVDIKGRNVPQQSFIGIAFHIQDPKTYDAIYFRPFNFENADSARRKRAVQYVSMPNFPWEKLRKEHPGQFEKGLNPAPNGDEWFHAKITVEGKRVKVFVNGAEQPNLEVEKLTSTSSGSIALWVGYKSNGSFANLKITPK